MLEQIKTLAKERKLTVAEVERMAGLTPRTVYKWDENIPSVDKVKRVADALSVTVDELLSTN